MERKTRSHAMIVGRIQMIRLTKPGDKDTQYKEKATHRRRKAEKANRRQTGKPEEIECREHGENDPIACHDSRENTNDIIYL